MTIDYGNRRADNRHPECEGTEARLSECLVPGPVTCSSVGVTCQTESKNISVHYYNVMFCLFMVPSTLFKCSYYYNAVKVGNPKQLLHWNRLEDY